MRTVLIISNTGDIHCDFLVDACSRRELACFRLNTDRFRRAGLLDWRIDTCGRQCRLTDIDLLIYRRPVPAHQLRTDVEPWIGRLLDTEWTAVECALSYAVRGRVMNGLAGSAAAQNKLVQLQSARNAGLMVPETIVSTDLRSLQTFAAQHRCITKGIVNAFHIDGKSLRSAFTTYVDPLHLATYDPQGCPTILQRAIEPRAIWRIVVIGEKAIGFRFHGPDLLRTADSRQVERSLDGARQSIPPDVSSKLFQMCRGLDIEFASADFVEDAIGQLWFLDLNPEGQWAFLEDKFGVRISDEIVGLAESTDSTL
jgi:hypothetical protein